MTQSQFDLSALNTMGLSSSCFLFSEISCRPDLLNCLANPQWAATRKVILGEGSNVILAPNIDAWVIRSAFRGFKLIKEDKQNVWLKIGSAENWHKTVETCLDLGFHGLENLALIPGTVGAAPVQNIGAYGSELSQYLASVDSLDLEQGTTCHWQATTCQFGYRDSCFKHPPITNKHLISHVTLKLSKTFQPILDYGLLTTKFANHQPSAQAVFETIIEIRQQKLPCPKDLPNTGSFFKNPLIKHEKLNQLLTAHPNLPHFKTPTNDAVKISAAWLIEQCGWKGVQEGDVGTHKKHALVIVNHGQATAQNILDFADKIKQSVQHRFGIELSSEINHIL